MNNSTTSVGECQAYSPEIEDALLGHIFARPEIVAKMTDAHPRLISYFYDVRRSEIASAAIGMILRGELCDPLTIKQHLKRPEYLESLGDVPYLGVLIGKAGYGDEWMAHANIARSLWKRRRRADAGKLLLRDDAEATALAQRILGDVGFTDECEASNSLERVLAEREFDPNYSPQLLAAVLSCGGTPICTRDNLTAVTAGPKVGKSAIIGGMMGAIMAVPGCDTLGFTSENPNGLAVIHFDTEQGKDDHAMNIWRAIRRAGRETRPDWLKSYFVSGLTVKQLQAALWLEADRQAQKFGGIHSIFIDGVADMVNDVNDPEESFAWVSTLHGGAIKYNCPIITVIHLNPGSDTKTRGHLGSQLERKAETNLKLDKDSDGVTTVWSDKQRRAPILKGKGPRFQWCNQSQMHVTVQPGQSPKEIERRAEAIELCAEVFSNRPSMRRGELEKAVGVTLQKSARTSSRIVSEWDTLGVIEKSVAGLWVKAS